MPAPSASDGLNHTPGHSSFFRRTAPLGRFVLASAGFIAAYLLLHLLATRFRTSVGISPWYPPPALSLVLIFWGGRRYLPTVFAAVLITETQLGVLADAWPIPLAVAAILALGYGTAGLMLRQLLARELRPYRVRDLVSLLVIGVGLAPLLVATAIVALLQWHDQRFDGDLLLPIVTFWIGDAVGVVSLCPLLLVLLQPRSPAAFKIALGRQLGNAEFYCQLLLIGLLAWISALAQQTQAISTFYLCGVPLLWMAVRQGFARAALGVLITNASLIALLIGPARIALYLTDFQLFILMISLIGLTIGAVVSERQEADAALRQGEALFRSLIENASDLISILDRDGKILYASPSHGRVFGYADDLIGRNVLDFVHPDDYDEVIEVLRRKFSGQPVGSTVQYRFRTAAGSWCSIESIGNVIAGKNGQPQRLIINSRDITERKRVEAALVALAQGVAGSDGLEFYGALVKHLAQALHAEYAFLCVRDPDSAHLTALGCWERGQARDNISYASVGTPCQRVIDEGSAVFPSGVQALFPDDNYLREHQIEGYMGVSLRAGDTAIGVLCAMTLQPIQEARFNTSLLQIFAQRAAAELDRARAAEERMQIERNLMEAQRLESLGLLAGGIAHDFNNFLTTIMGNVGLALLETETDSLQQGYLATIETATRRAADLSRQMLAYSGKGRFIVSQVVLNEMVAEIIALLNVVIGKQIDLICDFASDLPAVEVDATQIRQVLMNLIVNASDAIGAARGTITLRTGVAVDDRGQRQADPPVAYAFVEVSDSGHGMDPATMASIFEPFFTTKPSGRGLGLAAVQGIVRAHRGVLKVSSEPGRGSTFKVLLPIAPLPNGRPEQPRHPASRPTRGAAGAPQLSAEAYLGGAWLSPAPGARTASGYLRAGIRRAAQGHAGRAATDWRSGGMVLVIDDEEAIRTTIATMLEWLGFRTIQAADGPSGLALAQQSDEIVAVLLDMTMPGPSGEATLRDLRAAGNTVPVVLMSGYAQTETLSRLVEAGQAGFLHKPFTIDELQAVLALAGDPRVGPGRPLGNGGQER